MVVWTLLLMSIHVLLNNVWVMVLVAYFFGLSLLMEDSSCYLKIIKLILKNIPYAWLIFAPWKLLDKTAMNCWTFMDCAYNVKYMFFMFLENMCLNICLNDIDCSTFKAHFYIKHDLWDISIFFIYLFTHKYHVVILWLWCKILRWLLLSLHILVF